MPEIESFEVQGTPYDQHLDKNSMINQLVEDMIPSHAGYGFKVKFCGENQAVITYHSFEMHLPRRMKEAEHQANECFKNFEKNLKKRFKSETGKTLKLKELKDERVEHIIEKVSINERYYFRSVRTYEI